MNVSFLIGNGFDRGLGLRTSFRDFLPVYCAEPSAHSDVDAFKYLLQEDGSLDLWSDFEKALGAQTTHPPLNREESLERCLEDFERCFAGYLEREQDRIDYDACGAEIRQAFTQSLCSYRDRLEFGFLQEATERLSNEDSITYHLLDFNYTNVLDRLCEGLRRGPILNRSYADHLGELIHVHGTTREAMILGVDNIRQVVNPDLFSSPRQHRLLVKPLLNQQCGQSNDTRAIQCIQESDEICVFGMALGETDNTWWRLLRDWLTEREDRQLLLFFHCDSSAALFPQRVLRRREEWKERFFAQAGVPQTARETLGKRVYAVGSYGLFDLKPILKDYAARDSLAGAGV